LVKHQDQKIQIPEDQAIFIFQAVRELLFNVVKHADVTEATVSVRLTSMQEVEVLVQDFGIGFHPFLGPTDYTIPGKFGLFSIRERSEALGGFFHLDSAPERGTMARIVVPLQPAPAPVQIPEDGKGVQQSLSRFMDGDARKKSVRIVLVDDHAIIRQGMRTLLENQTDFMVVGEAQNGEDALDVINNLHPDIVVMDVNMPKLNGIEATKLLTQQHPSIKVIGLSVHEDKHVEKLLLEAGASTYVTKSSVASQLVEAIRHVVKPQPIKIKM
jgi:CheY-like chemotaxis protein